MKSHPSRTLIFYLALFLITSLAYIWFLRSSYATRLISWTQIHPLLFFLSLVTIKAVGIVWPPAPGSILTLGSIPIIGWPHAYLADLTGSLIGSSFAFFLGKKYGLAFLNHLIGDTLTQKISKIRIKKHRELESIFLIRLAGGATVFELVAYGAGILNLQFKNFIVGSLLSHLVIGVPAYYLIGNTIAGRHLRLNFLLLLLLLPLLWKLRRRYLE